MQTAEKRLPVYPSSADEQERRDKQAPALRRGTRRPAPTLAQAFASFRSVSTRFPLSELSVFRLAVARKGPVYSALTSLIVASLPRERMRPK